MATNKILRAFAALLIAFSVSAVSSCAGSPSENSDTSQTVTAAPETTQIATEVQTTTAPETNAETAATSGAGKVLSDITYKTVGTTELQLDIYNPTVEVDGKIPVLIYVHGGSWLSGDRSIEGYSTFGTFFDDVRALGVAVVPVSYRLTTSEITYPAHINDVCDAIRFVVKHADEYNFDTSRIGLIGFSAGGHLSLLAGFCTTMFGDDPELAGTDFDVKCVIDFCGPTDFTQLSDYTDDTQRIYAMALLKGFLGVPLEGNEQVYAGASPITYVGKNPDLSLIIFQGKSDELVPYVQVDRLYAKCVEAGMDVQYYPVENAMHAFTPFDTTKPITPTMDEIVSDCIIFIKNKLL
jgi:Esterase/lipase